MATKTIHHRQKLRETSFNLNSRDIEGNNRLYFIGAQPKVWAAETVNRPDLHNTFDVIGAGPRMLHFELNKPEFNLTNADIKGSIPCVN